MAKPIPLARLSALFVIALAVRGIFAAMPADRAMGDQIQYLELAENLKTNHVFGPDSKSGAHRAPLYPAILAVLGSVNTLVLQVLAGAALAPLVYLLAETLVSPRWATIAGLAMAVSPMSSRYCSLYMTETLFTFLLVVGAFFQMIRKPAACGICFGLAALIRPVLLPFVVLLPLLAWKRAYRPTIVISACGLAVIAPWTVRNAVVLHRFIPLATAGWGSNLFQGTLDVPRVNPWPLIMQERAGDQEAGMLRRGLTRIYQHPLDWVRVRLKQYPILFLDDGAYLGAWARPYLWGADLALLLLAAAGWWRLRPGPHIWAFPLYTAVSQLPMWTEPRYSLPMVPFLVVLACGAFESGAAIRQNKPAENNAGKAGS